MHPTRRDLLKAGAVLPFAVSARAAATAGPLRAHPANPRYFADSTGNPVYLTGSHTWANLQDVGLPPVPRFVPFPGPAVLYLRAA